MLGRSDLVRSVLAYWGEEFSGTWPTVYPGMQEDASELEAWVELTFPFASEQRGRDAGRQLVNFTFDVHCFAKVGKQWARIQEMADEVRRVLAGRVVAVRDFDLSALPAIGSVQFQEAEVRDLSRSERVRGERGLSHVLVSVRGVACMAEG